MKNSIYEAMIRRCNSLLQLALVFMMFFVMPAKYYSQQSYTFTNAAATGSIGPNQTQINTAYALTNLNGSVTVLPIGIQNWTVPITGGYRIEARGAQGYGTFGGRGAIMAGDFTLTAGTVLKIAVGQQGAPPVSPGTNQYGGGGGSFITYTNNAALVIAGGGGGSWATSFLANADGTITPNGKAGINGTSGGGGTGGGGGSSGNAADGGGGLTGNGGGTAAGLSFVNGATGGGGHGHGGFGGGGGASSWNNRRGCGGGGYSGGGGADGGTTNFPEGGGGGSINNGINQTNTSGANLGHGRVIISELCNIKIYSSGTSSTNPSICSGQSLTLTTTAVSNYTWSTGNSTNTMIVVAPTSSTSYSIVGTSSLNCVAQAVINVTVNSAPPVLTTATIPSTVCFGQSAILTATGALTYTWTGGVVNGQPFVPTSTSGYTVSGQNGCGTTSAVTSITVAPLPISAISSPTLVCEGYTATLTAISSVNGYTWQPVSLYGPTVVVAPMANTIYTVTATDGTCTGTQTVAIVTKVTPTITATTANSVVCEGGSVVLTASGGSTYNWTPGNLSGNTITVTPNISTLYSVAGTNSVGCTASANQVILVNASPTININASKTLVCLGDQIILLASGASSYTWTNGPSTAGNTVSPTGPAVYTVTGSSPGNPCAGTKTISLSAIVPNVTAATSPTAICIGGNATLAASGASSYTWNGIPGPSSQVVAPVSTTIYNLVANTQSGTVNCPTTKTVQVVVNPNPTITAVATKSLTCKGNSNTLTASGATTYSWSTGATTNTIVVNPNTTTIYNVTGIDSKGCQSAQLLLQANVSACNSLSELNKGNQYISVFPNPSSGEFTVETSADIVLKLMNGIGQEIKVISLTEANNHKANVKDLANGVYFLVGENADGKVNQKIVVAK